MFDRLFVTICVALLFTMNGWAGDQPLVYGPTQATPITPVPQSFIPAQPWEQAPQPEVRPSEPTQIINEPGVLERLYQDDLFHYTWIDYGDAPGLRIHRIEMTNAWSDMRSLPFFSRPICEDTHHFNTGISFAVQWWKDEASTIAPTFDSPQPPVLYDLYLDIGWRVALTPQWLIDLAISPGLATDFRVTPPDGFRMRGHALTMFDMLPNVRLVGGISYQNRASIKVLPVAGVAIDVTDRTRIEAIFPQPRIIHHLGEWRGTAWDLTLGGEFGGAAWAFKNEENTREVVDYRDYRILFGLGWNTRKGQGTIQVGYVFERELRYSRQSTFDFDPGNAWMIRVGWDY